MIWTKTSSPTSLCSNLREVAPRYDKRTFAYGDRLAGTSFTVDDEVTDDAVGAACLLATQAHVDPRHVFVLGHSLGALVAPLIGRRDPPLAGLTLLAAPAQPLIEASIPLDVHVIGHRRMDKGTTCASHRRLTRRRRATAGSGIL
jgi:dienelactone hydrolase